MKGDQTIFQGNKKEIFVDNPKQFYSSELTEITHGEVMAQCMIKSFQT